MPRTTVVFGSSIVAVVMVAAMLPGRAQCDDMDGDGYCYVVGCSQPGPCDCNDADPDVHSAAVEVCDGLDNDCNGLVDDAPDCMQFCLARARLGEPSMVPQSSEYDDYKDGTLVWTGIEFGAVWHEYRPPGGYSLGFTRFDAAGRQIGGVVRIALDWEEPDNPDLVWTGSEYGVVYDEYHAAPHHDTDVFFLRVDRYGNRLNERVLVMPDVGSTSEDASIAWSGHEYGVAWRDDRDTPDTGTEIFFRRFDAAGQPIGDPVRVTHTSDDSYFQDVIWNGSQWVIAWFQSGASEGIYMVMLEPDGTPTGPAWPIETMDDVFDVFDLSWTGSGYGLLSTTYASIPGEGYVYFKNLDGAGQPSSDPTQLNNDFADFEKARVSLTWNGREHEASWADWRDGDADVFMARLGPDGRKIGFDLQVSETEMRSVGPSGAWSGHLYGVSFHEWTHSSNGSEKDMYLARVQCVHADDDEDGYIPGVDCDDAWDAVWLRPSEVHELRFMDSETLAWGAPEDLGAVPEQIVYDLLRSEQPTDFGPDAVCVEAGDGSDEQAMDPESPPVGQAFFYLVRAQNDCEPGEGTLGAASTGIERSGQSCE